MKPFFAFLFLSICSTAFSQDTIVSFRGKRFPSQIVDKAGDSIHYKRTDYIESKTYSIAKNAVLEIKYGNGTTESFFTEAEKSRSIDELKKHITDMIDAYGYEEDSDRQKYKATFEGDYLRMAIMVGEKVKSKGFLFDFGNVFQFHPVSERNKTDAYINIWIAFLDNPKKMKWAKQKLIMKVKGHAQAHDINRSLQYLNRLLRDQKMVVK